MAKTRTISDETIIAALLSCPTLEAAAEQCGLSIRQLYERRQSEAFVRKLREAQDEALATTTRFLQKATGSAANVLVDIAETPGRPAQVRISAARAVLDMAVKYTEAVDVQARLEALERYAEGADDEH